MYSFSGEVDWCTVAGNAMHKEMAGWLAKRYKGTDFKFAIKPGQRGIDVTVIKGKPGFKFAEFKPRTSSGQRSFEVQMRRWGHDPAQTKVFTYDRYGRIYEGWRP